MRRKTVSGIMLSLLLIGMLTLAFNIQPVEASGTIYIRADGSIEPPTANITSVDNITYTFIGNINEPIVVEKDNIVVDGTGYTLEGTGSGRGIDLTGRSNVTIKNMEIKSFSISSGIWLGYGSSYNTISGNNITNNANGIALYYSSNYNTISGNNITNNGWGIALYESSRNSISGNKIMNNDGDGIRIAHYSNYNTISENTITNNWRGIHLEYPYYSSNNKIYHNNLMDNTYQVVTHDGDINIWDDGYPSGGNCWSNYTSVDVKSGPYQNETGSDGIGDTPYTIDANNRDNYPLMIPLGDVEPPVAEAGPDLTVGFGTTVPFDGSKSIDDIAIKSYVWTFTDITPQTLTGMRPEYTFNNVGDYEVTLNVSDYTGKWNTDTVTVTVLPECTLTIDSSPTGVTFTVDGVSRTTPWSGTYSENSSVTLIIPEIHTVGDTRYYWSQWSDGNTSQSRTVIMNTSIILTAQYEPGPIYIRADGSVSPNTVPISTVDNVTYTFTDNIYDEIFVWRDNIVVDGNGYTLQGTASGCGFILDYMKNNLTIQNVNIKNFTYGIYVYYSSNNTIFGNNVTNNCYGIYLQGSSSNAISGNNITTNTYGIYLFESSGNTISGNNLTNNRDGIYLKESSNNTISGNNITNNSYGILLFYSSNNTLRNNDASDNNHNFGVSGLLLSHYTHDIDDSNTVDGKPVYYWVNRQDMTIPLDAGYVALVNCTNITVRNQNLTNNGQGVLLASTTNSAITKNNITNNGNGIYLFESSQNTINGNNITNNGSGIGLLDSSNNSIFGNDITNNEGGISLANSQDNIVSSNMLSNNKLGIHLWHACGNTLAENNVLKSWGGMTLDYSNDSTITGNNISECTFYGISLYLSNGSIIYHNNFINNYYQVVSYESFNVWDNGEGGNYWSDHVCTGNPSDGSQPYIINENNIDHYPFQDPNGWLLPPPKPVGGKATPINIPTNKPETSALWIWLTTIILSLAVTVVYVKKRKRNTEINS